MSEQWSGQSRLAQPTLSVVLPNYNHARLISRALDALLAQERQADEILVIDDGSIDDSVAVIEKYAAKFPTIRLLRSEKNLGAIRALIRGLNTAQGQYVYFAAADDQVVSGFFAKALDSLTAHPQLGLFCGEAQLLDGKSGRLYGVRPPVRPLYRAGIVDPASVKRLLARSDNWILTGCAVFRREAVIWAGGFDPNLGSFADGYMTRKVALSLGFCYAPQIVAKWYIYPGSVSRKTVYELDNARKMLDLVPAKLSMDPTFPTWYPLLFQQRWRFAVARLSLENRPVDRELLLGLGAQTVLDRYVLTTACKLPGTLTNVLALAWLWFRFRPYPLTAMARTALARLWERYFR